MSVNKLHFPGQQNILIDILNLFGPARKGDDCMTLYDEQNFLRKLSIPDPRFCFDDTQRPVTRPEGAPV